jgi:hypothetical protein
MNQSAAGLALAWLGLAWLGLALLAFSFMSHPNFHYLLQEDILCLLGGREGPQLNQHPTSTP